MLLAASALRADEPRYPGSPANLAMEQLVSDNFTANAALSGEMRFTAPCFVPGHTAMAFDQSTNIILHPLHPTLFRPGNFSEGTFSAPLVYLGCATDNDLLRATGVPLKDSLIVLDFNSGANWQRLLRFSPRGFIFLEDPDAATSEAWAKVYATEAAVPRFLMAKQDSPNLLKHALIDAEPSRWKNQTLRNLWTIIPGSDPRLAREAIVITAPLDANCVAPGLAHGAQSAANLDLLLNIFESFRTNPPPRTVVLAAVNAHTQKYLGERILAWNLLMPSEKVERINDLIQTDLQQKDIPPRVAELNRRELEMNMANRGIREALSGKRVAFVVSLDLNWQSDRIGFYTGDFWGTQKWQYGFGRNTTRIAASMKAPENMLEDTLTNPGGMPEGYFFPSSANGVIFFQYADNTPAFSLANVFTSSGHAFLPSDTLSNLDTATVSRVSEFSMSLLRAMCADEQLTAATELPKTPFQSLWSVRIRPAEFDRFSGNVMPTIPLPGTAIILHDNGSVSAGPDVSGAYICLTDERAASVFYGLNKVTTRERIFTSAFRFDPSFTTIDRAVDAGDAHDRVNSNLTRSEELTLALFPCREQPVPSRADSSLVSARSITSSDYIMIDALLGAAPRRYGASGIQPAASSRKFPNTPGPAAVYAEPESSIKVLTTAGRLALNASADSPEGEGFTATSPLAPDFLFTAAHDMAFLNKARLASLRAAPDQLAADLVRRGDSAFSRAVDARIASNHAGYLRSLDEALGAQAKAYEQTSAMRNDMLKAVVLYMALLVPFCFFVQKLVSGTSRIELQMGLFLLIFTGAYLLFRFIHPAFGIARAPEAIFIAFIMGALGLFVIYLLHARFEGEMRLLFHSLSGREETGIAYTSASQQAMMIGVNNMRRRRIRTTLTTITIVLVTFTMLAFSSVSRKLSPTMISKSASAPYTGLMYHWPGRTMDESTLNVLGELLHGHGTFLTRRWLIAPRTDFFADQLLLPFKVAAPQTGRTASIEAVLGLSTNEDGFLERISLAAGHYFSSDDAHEVILPASVAQVLNVTTADVGRAAVVMNSRQFTVAGIIRDEHLRVMRDLDQHPVLPVRSTPRRTSIESPTATEKDAIPLGDEETAGIAYFDTSVVMLMPIETCRRMGGQPFSVSLKLPPGEPVWPLADRLLTATSARFYIGSRVPVETGTGGRSQEPGVYFVGAGYRTSIGGLSRLIIPLLIAGTILLNTMLGSVYERRREIAIYNAIGLNPTHIGIFFLAEAFVYSVIGAVGGYLIGQTAALALSKLGLLGGINLNFSSLTVGYVVLFTIAIVLLSTIYPAVMASRAAVPSGRRTWSMPEHDGNTMKTIFPFIYPPEMLGGVMKYVEEYFAGFSEASIGMAIAEQRGRTSARDASGHEVCTLDYRVSLPPYDLGVTQTVTLTGSFDARLGFCRIAVEIRRISGQDTNWEATNRPFLEKLRHYLMNWRNLDSRTQSGYVAEADKWQKNEKE